MNVFSPAVVGVAAGVAAGADAGAAAAAASLPALDSSVMNGGAQLHLYWSVIMPRNCIVLALYHRNPRGSCAVAPNWRRVPIYTCAHTYINSNDMGLSGVSNVS